MPACGCNLLVYTPKVSPGNPLPAHFLGFLGKGHGGCFLLVTPGLAAASSSFWPLTQGCPYAEADAMLSCSWPIAGHLTCPGVPAGRSGAWVSCAPVATWGLPEMPGWQRGRCHAGHRVFLGLIWVGFRDNLYRDESQCSFLRATYFSAIFSMVGAWLRPLTGAFWSP